MAATPRGGARADAPRAGMTALTGVVSKPIGGVWVWDVRPLLDG
ncbi:hypothetical protein [Micromonospora sp. NPDC004704]